MPRIVDHERRRRELVEATWRVVARRGLEGATLRQVADEAGYAHGALKPYFPTKADLLDATYAHVFERTEARIEVACVGSRGLAAVRRLCLEVLPLDEDLLAEARLVVSFWDRAARHEAEAQASAATLAAWRARLLAFLDEADEVGALRPEAGRPVVVDLLLTWLFGSQVTAVVDPGHHGPEGLREQLEVLLSLLGAGSSTVGEE